MSWINLFIIILASFGVTWTVVYAEILDILGIRQFLHKSSFLKSLTSCSFCSANYVGIFYSLPLYYLQKYDSHWFYILSFPFLIASSSYIIDKFTCLIEDLALYFKK